MPPADTLFAIANPLPLPAWLLLLFLPRWKYTLPVARLVLALVQAWVLYAIPMVGLALTNTWWVLLVWWALAGLAVSGLFVLGHDASHGALLDSRKANRVVAQVCMVPSFHVEAAWDLGHNRIHHGYTTRLGFDFVWHPARVQEYAVMGRFARLRHRVEWSRLGSGAYFLRTVWWQKMHVMAWFTRSSAGSGAPSPVVRILSTSSSAASGDAAASAANRGWWTARCGVTASRPATRPRSKVGATPSTRRHAAGHNTIPKAWVSADGRFTIG